MKLKLEANGRDLVALGIYETMTRWVLMFRVGSRCFTRTVRKGTR